MNLKDGGSGGSGAGFDDFDMVDYESLLAMSFNALHITISTKVLVRIAILVLHIYMRFIDLSIFLSFYLTN